jgi:hypothetical protein
MRFFAILALVLMCCTVAPHVARAQDAVPADAGAAPEPKTEQINNAPESPNPNEEKPASVNQEQPLDPRETQMNTDDTRQQKQDAVAPGEAEEKVEKVNPEMNQESDCEGNMKNPEKCGWVPCETDKDCAVSGAKCVTQGYPCGGGHNCFAKFCQIPQ